MKLNATQTTSTHLQDALSQKYNCYNYIYGKTSNKEI
jgi:hypothetical protein